MWEKSKIFGLALKNQGNSVSMKTIIRSLSIKCDFTRMRVSKMEDKAFVIHTQVCVISTTSRHVTFNGNEKQNKKADKHCINWRNILCINEQKIY